MRASAAEKGVRVSPPTKIQHNTPTRTSSQEQQRRGIPPTATQHAHAAKRERVRLKAAYEGLVLKLNALGNPEKPNRDVLRNALLCSYPSQKQPTAGLRCEHRSSLCVAWRGYQAAVHDDCCPKWCLFLVSVAHALVLENSIKKTRF